MSVFEKLNAIASGQGEVFEMAREMIGKPELALMLAKAAIIGTTEELSPTAVARVLGITPQGASKKIENCAVKEQNNGSRKSC
jgi:hypothetical protein